MTTVGPSLGTLVPVRSGFKKMRPPIEPKSVAVFPPRSGIYFILAHVNGETRTPSHPGLLRCLIHYLVRYCG